MKTSRIFSCLIILGLSVGRIARANVIINEIAWMGTSSSANAEWIELYNNGSDAVTLDGWSLRATDGSPSIPLSGQVSAGGYFLLERTNDEAVPGVTAGQIYSGSLGNAGEHLELKNNLDEVQDNVDATEGWPAGDNTSKQTMNRSGSSWITVDATPGATNHEVAIASSAPPAAPKTPSVPGSVAEKEDDASDVLAVKPDPKYTAKTVIPDFATAGVLVPLSAIVKQDGKRDMVTGRFEWYFGDGSADRYMKNGPFSHVFAYPGEYSVIMEYYSNVWKEEPDSIHKKKITVVPASISITGLTDDGGVTIANDASRDIDLDHWKLFLGGHSYEFPKYTIVPKGGSLSISSRTIGIKATDSDQVILTNPSGTVITETEVQNDK